MKRAFNLMFSINRSLFRSERGQNLVCTVQQKVKAEQRTIFGVWFRLNMKDRTKLRIVFGLLVNSHADEGKIGRKICNSCAIGNGIQSIRTYSPSGYTEVLHTALAPWPLISADCAIITDPHISICSQTRSESNKLTWCAAWVDDRDHDLRCSSRARSSRHVQSATCRQCENERAGG